MYLVVRGCVVLVARFDGWLVRTLVLLKEQCNHVSWK